MSRAGLALGATAGTVNIASNVQFCIDGIFATVNAVNNAAFSNNHLSLAAGCACLFGVWVTAAGVVSTTQGKVVDTASLATAGGSKVLQMPDVVANSALLGLIKVVTAGTAVFVPGTTNLNATNVTATYYDTTDMPTKPFLI
jgi:hypothetical protein